nr:MAG TPA: Protein of unknown function (DUF2973) [Caudoviricetes sp.]
MPLLYIYAFLIGYFLHIYVLFRIFAIIKS